MQNAQRLARALLLSAALINVRPLMAANVYWDTAVAPNYQAGGGTWGADSYWSTNDGTTLSPWVSGDTAIFQGDATLGAYSIALSSSQTLAGLTLGSPTTFGNWSFTGSGMSLGANSTFTVNAGSTASIANAISGAFSLTKAGTGTLTLSGVNTYTGTTTVSAGTLTVQAGGTLGGGDTTINYGASLVINGSSVVLSGLSGAGTLNVNSGGTLTFNRTSKFTEYTGKLSGSGAIIKNGAGEIALGGDATGFSGPITLNGGMLSALSLGSGDITVTNSARIAGFIAGTSTWANKLIVNNGTTVSFGNLFVRTRNLTLTNEIVLNGTGSLSFDVGTTTLTGGLRNLGTGTFTIGAVASLQLGGSTSFVLGGLYGDGALNVNSGATLTFDWSSGFTTFNGTLSGAGAIIKKGAGELALSVGANGFTGPITIDGGTLTAVSLGSGDIAVTNSARISGFTASTSIWSNKLIVNNGTLGLGNKFAVTRNLTLTNEIVLNGTGSLSFDAGTTTLTGSLRNLGTGGLSIGSGAVLQLGDGGAAGTINNLNVNSAGTLAFKRSDDVTYSGILSGVGGLTQAGTGKLTLAGANTYSGTTTVSAGTLTVATGGSIGTGNLVLSGGRVVMSSLDVGRLTATAGTFDGVLTGTGGLNKTGPGTLVLGGVNTYTGTTTVSAGTLTVAAGGTLGRGDLSIATGANLVINGSATVLSKLSGSGSISFDSSGELVFGGDTTGFSGMIELKRGLLSALSLGIGDITVSNSARIAGYAANDSSWANKILVNNGTLGVGKAGAKLKLTKEIVLSGSGSLSFDAGTTTLTGSLRNQGSGTWTIAAGAALRLGDGGTTGSVDGGFAFNLNTVGDLVFDRSDNINYSGSLSGSGGLAQAGTGILTLSGVNTYTGSTTVSAGTLTVDAGGTIGSGDLVLSGGRVSMDSLDVARLRASAGTFDGVLTGTAGLSKVGDGTLVLNGANTYTGGTTAQAGTIVANNNGAFGFGQVSLAGGALDIRNSVISNNISLNTLDNYTQLTGDGGKIAGIISGDGGFTKVGNGTLTLTGDNTFTGGVLISEGVLQVDGKMLGYTKVAAGAKLTGDGKVGDVFVYASGAISAGASGAAGTLQADWLYLQGGAKLELDITKASLGGASGFDRIVILGRFDLSEATPYNKYKLVLAGLPEGFDRAGDYSFAFIKYGELNLGDNTNIADLFTIDSSALKDQDGASFDASKFSLVDDAVNQQILLNYGSPNISAIPEPSSYGLGIGCLGLAIAAVRRRRRLVVS